MTINFILLVFTISLVINTSFCTGTGIISKILENSPLYPGRSIYPSQQPQTHLPDHHSTSPNKNNAFFHIDENVVLKTNDLLTCKVLHGNDETNNRSEFKVNTPPLSGNAIFYTYLPVSSGETCFTIKIRAEKYAYLALSENPYKGGRLFDIVLGISGPVMQSSIRKNLAEEVAKIPTPDIINGKEFREFVVTWTGGTIMISRGTNMPPFLYYQEPNMYPVNYIGIATFDKPGTWIVTDNGHCKNKPATNSDNLVTECWLQQKEKKTRFDHLILLQKYYLHQMTNNYEKFNKSLQHQNDNEFIEIYKYELIEDFKKSKEIHNEIILDDVKNDENGNRHMEKIDSYNEAEKTFEKIRNFFFQYYGTLQNLSNHSNMMVETLDSKCDGKTPNSESENMKLISLPEEYYQITSTEGCFTFKVHRAAGNIRITLTNGFKKSLKAQIIIGQNSEIQTWKDSKIIENHKKTTPKFELRGEYQSYWISWNAQRIFVGQIGEIDGFINTNNAVDFTELKYVNVWTANKGEKQWEIDEYHCPHDIDIRIDD